GHLVLFVEQRGDARLSWAQRASYTIGGDGASTVTLTSADGRVVTLVRTGDAPPAAPGRLAGSASRFRFAPSGGVGVSLIGPEHVAGRSNGPAFETRPRRGAAADAPSVDQDRTRTSDPPRDSGPSQARALRAEPAELGPPAHQRLRHAARARRRRPRHGR